MFKLAADVCLGPTLLQQKIVKTATAHGGDEEQSSYTTPPPLNAAAPSFCCQSSVRHTTPEVYDHNKQHSSAGGSL